VPCFRKRRAQELAERGAVQRIVFGGDQRLEGGRRFTGVLAAEERERQLVARGRRKAPRPPLRVSVEVRTIRASRGVPLPEQKAEPRRLIRRFFGERRVREATCERFVALDGVRV